MGFNQILVELQDVFGDDRRIAESAWTSSYSNCKKEFKTEADVARVVRMLGESKPAHGVPFESVVFYFWIRMPISTDRQFVTHRIQSMNGMSGRYRTMPADFYQLPQDVIEILQKSEHTQHKEILAQYGEVCRVANDRYQNWVSVLRTSLENGSIDNAEFKRAREVVRNILPQGNMTERTSTMNLRSFANFQKQRNDAHAQPEIRHIAQLMLEAVQGSGKIPIALEVLKENGWAV